MCHQRAGTQGNNSCYFLRRSPRGFLRTEDQDCFLGYGGLLTRVKKGRCSFLGDKYSSRQQLCCWREELIHLVGITATTSPRPRVGSCLLWANPPFSLCFRPFFPLSPTCLVSPRTVVGAETFGKWAKQAIFLLYPYPPPAQWVSVPQYSWPLSLHLSGWRTWGASVYADAAPQAGLPL